MNLVTRLFVSPGFSQRLAVYQASQRTFDARLSAGRTIRQQFDEIEFCAHIARLYPYETQWELHIDEMCYCYRNPDACK